MSSDQAPKSSAFVRMHMIRAVDFDLAGKLDRAEFCTRVTADDRAETTVSLRWGTYPPLIEEIRRWDEQASAVLRKLPGADPGVVLGSPNRTYMVYWDGVRAPV